MSGFGRGRGVSLLYYTVLFFGGVCVGLEGRGIVKSPLYTD